MDNPTAKDSELPIDRGRGCCIREVLEMNGWQLDLDLLRFPSRIAASVLAHGFCFVMQSKVEEVLLATAVIHSRSA